MHAPLLLCRRLLARGGLAIAAWLLLPALPFQPEPAPRLQQLPEAQLRALASSLRLRQEPEFTAFERQAAHLGRQFFFDTRFSKGQKIACFSCHQPARDFTDGRATALGLSQVARHTPSLVNSYAQNWFFWDGRADSLAAQVQGPLEASAEHGFDRGQVAQVLWQHYRAPLEALFGPWPSELIDLLDNPTPFVAHPPQPKIELPLSLAHYALSTISSTKIQSRWIQAGADKGMAPQKYFASYFVPMAEPQEAAVQRYLTLAPSQQQALDQLFYRFSWAIAQYQRGLVARHSPFDRFVDRLEGSDEPPQTLMGEGFSEQAWQGFQIFAVSGCANCHAGPLLSDQQFHNIGLEQRGEELDLGRAVGLLGAKADRFSCKGRFEPLMIGESCAELDFLRLDLYENVGAFKTPSLRNLERTAPYMHDGRFASLAEVLHHYNTLETEPAIGHRDESLVPLRLDARHLEQLEAFLRSLTAPVVDLHQIPVERADHRP
jgi:cytochrome c peroxidase